MSEQTARASDHLSINALEITLTGPFQIGDPLDFSQTTSDEYKMKQEAVLERMEELFPQYRWKIPESGGGQKYESDSSGIGKAHTPPYYLKCRIYCSQIKCNIEKYNVFMKKIDIKFYEFDFATVSVSCAIFPKFSSKASKCKIRASDVLRIVNELDNKIVKGQINQLRALISNVTKKFNSVIQENRIAKFGINEQIANATTNKKINDVEFLHRIFAYRVSKNSEIKAAQKTLNKIAKLSNGEWENEKFCSHFVGVANSAIIHNFNIERNCDNINSEIVRRYLSAYKTVLETANAYYFIAEYIKNGLFDYSRASVAIEESKKISKNSKEFDKAETGLNKFIFLTSNFFFMSDEFITNLSPQGKNIWDRISKAWNTRNATKMLQDQLQNSLQITDRVFTQTAKRKQKFANRIALAAVVFAGLSVASAAPNSNFNLEFEMDIWNSKLTIIFILVAISAIIGCFLLWKLFKRSKKVANKDFIMVPK